MMVKRKIIIGYSNDHLQINKEYFYNLVQEVENIRKKALELIDQYSMNYAKDSTDKKIENLLAILELPPNTKDLEVIKRQYRKLAKKYHPDVYKQSDNKFKEVSNAYEELCIYLQAS